MQIINVFVKFDSRTDSVLYLSKCAISSNRRVADPHWCDAFLVERLGLISFFADSEVDEDVGGWTAQQICTLIMYTAKSSGIANSTVDKFMKIFALVVDTTRLATDDERLRKFPRSFRSLGNFLGLKPPCQQNVVYICPAKKISLKKGQKEVSLEICGFTLTRKNDGPHRTYVCEACDTEWDKQHVEKDGNCFSAVPMKDILTSTMERYGKYCSSKNQKSPDNKLRDVKDGQRWSDMQLDDGTIVISIHADGASISKSSKTKMYVMFLHVLNIPVRVRINLWPMLLVWVGEDLPKDREAFLLFVTKQLQLHQKTSDRFSPIQWKSLEGDVVNSDVYVHSVYADSPERTTINGHLSHSAGEGCIYCLQVIKNL